MDDKNAALFLQLKVKFKFVQFFFADIIEYIRTYFGLRRGTSGIHWTLLSIVWFFALQYQNPTKLSRRLWKLTKNNKGIFCAFNITNVDLRISYEHLNYCNYLRFWIRPILTDNYFERRTLIRTRTTLRSFSVRPLRRPLPFQLLC